MEKENKLSLAYSPCPNDTFAFHAMINGLVDTEGLDFEEQLMDVQALNEKADAEAFSICKLSYHAYFRIADRYKALGVGSALGYGNGPILVVKDPAKWERMISGKLKEGETISVSLPGKWTTASLLFDIFFSEYAGHIIKRFELFSDIAGEILQGKVDAGVLIHEGRFVFEDLGLSKIADFGELWKIRTGLPLPLGLIAVRRVLPESVQEKVERSLRRSIEYAMSHPECSKQYIADHAQELSEEVQRKHVELFVNHYTLDLSGEGEAAIEALRKEYERIYGSR